MQEETKQSLWATRLQNHAASGQPSHASPCCALNGVTVATLHYWRKRLLPAAACSTKLIALPFSSCDSKQAMEVETPTGYVISLHSREGRFHWPEQADDVQAPPLTARQLRWLIDGLKWKNAVAH